MNRLLLFPVAPIVAAMLGMFGCASLDQATLDRKAELHLQIATDHFAKREYSKSIEEIRAALKITPNLPAAYNHLALVYLETKRHDRALEAFKKALALRPDYPEVMNNIGVLLNRQNKFGEAIGYFEQALQSENYLTPENAETNIGYAYFKMGKMREAVQHHQRALDISPTFCLAAKNLGDVYAKKKDYSRAGKLFKQAVTHCPLYEESRYKLALVLMRSGQKREAKVQLQKLVEHHKSGPFVERSQEVLKVLR